MEIRFAGRGTMFLLGIFCALSGMVKKGFCGPIQERFGVGPHDASSRRGINRADDRSETIRVEKPFIDFISHDFICRADPIEKPLDCVSGSVRIPVNRAPGHAIWDTDLHRAVARANDDYVRKINLRPAEKLEKPPYLPCAPLVSFAEWRVKVSNHPGHSYGASLSVWTPCFIGPPPPNAHLLGTLWHAVPGLRYELLSLYWATAPVDLRRCNRLCKGRLQPPAVSKFSLDVSPNASPSGRSRSSAPDEERRSRGQASLSRSFQLHGEREAQSSKVPQHFGLCWFGIGYGAEDYMIGLSCGYQDLLV